MKAKILQKKEDNKPSAFEHDISLKDEKSLKVELSSFVYNDLIQTQMNMKNKRCQLKNLMLILRSKTVKVS